MLGNIDDADFMKNPFKVAIFLFGSVRIYSKIFVSKYYVSSHKTMSLGTGATEVGGILSNSGAAGR